MRSAICLSSALLLWPLSPFALPLPSCLNPDTLPEDGVVPCAPVEHYGWSIDEGLPRRKARSAENMAEADATPVLRLRDDIVEHAIMEPEAPVRRDVEPTLSAAAKEGPVVDSRDPRTLKERWILEELEDLEVVDAESPGEYGDADAGPASIKRWTISRPLE